MDTNIICVKFYIVCEKPLAFFIVRVILKTRWIRVVFCAKRDIVHGRKPTVHRGEAVAIVTNNQAEDSAHSIARQAGMGFAVCRIQKEMGGIQVEKI